MFDADHSLLPKSGQLNELLGLNWGSEVSDVMEMFLLSPLREFLDRPSKKIRGQMVEIGFQLAAGAHSERRRDTELAIQQASDLLEALHSASLIIDDIQDDSHLRRGQPTVHRKHGVPLALNAGNWLYFWPLQNIDQWAISTETKLRVYRVCHRGLMRAHFGQALDVGLNIFKVPQAKIKSTCLASLELKSGALMAMGLCLGAVLGGASEELEQLCDRFGHAFGIALQMFDDAGNASIEGAKQFEDLLLKRPSWLVAVAAETLSAAQFLDFSDCVHQLPDSNRLSQWLQEHSLVQEARQRARQYLDEALTLLESQVVNERDFAKKQIRELADLLVRAYV
jgi:geranylgeranyl pyrophosphate synthase